jgi:hypothetical protein
MTAPDPYVVPFKGQYQEWCRLQLQFAHHDNWWIKEAQLKAGNFTLVLVGAVLGASKLLWSYRENIPHSALTLFRVMSGAVVLLGGLYAWDLFKTLVKSRKAAGDIAGLVKDPKKVLEPITRPAYRDWFFPIVITLIEGAAWGITLLYFGASSSYLLVPLVLWGALMGWGLHRSKPEEMESAGKAVVPTSPAPETAPIKAK